MGVRYVSPSSLRLCNGSKEPERIIHGGAATIVSLARREARRVLQWRGRAGTGAAASSHHHVHLHLLLVLHLLHLLLLL